MRQKTAKLAELQARSSRSCRFCRFLPHTQLVSLKSQGLRNLCDYHRIFVRLNAKDYGTHKVFTCHTIKIGYLFKLVQAYSCRKSDSNLLSIIRLSCYTFLCVQVLPDILSYRKSNFTGHIYSLPVLSECVANCANPVMLQSQTLFNNFCTLSNRINK